MIVRYIYLLVSCWLLTGAFTSIDKNQGASERGNTELSTDNETIRIGLLIPDDPATDPLSREAVHAVEMAVKRINEDGGIQGRNVEIVTRSCEGPWGVGSRQSVELIYDEDVSAIIGSLDGENAHLAEMVIAKAHIIYMGTRATDPTLSNANIPWFFRVLPSDRQQAERLMEEIYENRNLEQITVVSTDAYDDEMAANTFLRMVHSQKRAAPIIVEYNAENADFSEIIASLQETDSEGIAYFGRPDHLNDLIGQMERSGLHQPVYTTLSMLQIKDREIINSFSGKVMFVCPERWSGFNDTPFHIRFEEEYGYEPGIIAAYSYDGLNVLVESMKRGGTDTENIRENLSQLSGFSGVTGQLEFHENGDVVNNTFLCY